MKPPPAKTGLFVGLNKGHVVSKRELPPRPSARKGKSTKRAWFVRRVIREVAGLAPYEKRITEILRFVRTIMLLSWQKESLGHTREPRRSVKRCSIFLGGRDPRC